MNCKPFDLISVTELLEQPAAPDLVEGLIPDGALVGIKICDPRANIVPFLIATAVAYRTPFAGRSTQMGDVLFLGARGQIGVRSYVRERVTHFERGDSHSLMVASAPTSLSLIRSLERNRDLSLIVIEAFGGGVAHAQLQMASLEFLNAVDALRKDGTTIVAYEASIAVSTHAFRDSLDVEFDLSVEGSKAKLTCAKMRDGELPGPVLIDEPGLMGLERVLEDEFADLLASRESGGGLERSNI